MKFNIEIELEDPDSCDDCPCLDDEFMVCKYFKVNITSNCLNSKWWARAEQCKQKYGVKNG
jgi:hypothetical protein